MTSICLTPAEVTAALTGAEFEVRRLIKVPTTKSGYRRGEPLLAKEWPHMRICADGNPAFLSYSPSGFPERYFDKGIAPPFASGTVLCGKETWARYGDSVLHQATNIGYSVDHWRSAATMPRWASRLSLEVMAVRCELQDGVWWWVTTMRRKG